MIYPVCINIRPVILGTWWTEIPHRDNAVREEKVATKSEVNILILVQVFNVFISKCNGIFVTFLFSPVGYPNELLLLHLAAYCLCHALRLGSIIIHSSLSKRLSSRKVLTILSTVNKTDDWFLTCAQGTQPERWADRSNNDDSDIDWC